MHRSNANNHIFFLSLNALIFKLVRPGLLFVDMTLHRKS